MNCKFGHDNNKFSWGGEIFVGICVECFVDIKIKPSVSVGWAQGHCTGVIEFVLGTNGASASLSLR